MTAPYPLPEAAGPGVDGDPDPAPAGETIPCPGCHGTATRYPDGMTVCHDSGSHMSPEQAAEAQRAKDLVHRLTTHEITADEAITEMRGWTP